MSLFDKDWVSVAQKQPLLYGWLLDDTEFFGVNDPTSTQTKPKFNKDLLSPFSQMPAKDNPNADNMSVDDEKADTEVQTSASDTTQPSQQDIEKENTRKWKKLKEQHPKLYDKWTKQRQEELGGDFDALNKYVHEQKLLPIEEQSFTKYVNANKGLFGFMTR